MLEDDTGEAFRTDVATVRANAAEITDVDEDVRRLIEVAVRKRATHPCSLSNYVESEVDSLRSKHPEVDITVDIPPDCYVDENAFLAYLFQPLIENSIEHNDTGDLEISIRSDVEDDRIITEIVDNGCGVSTEELQRFGEPPAQGDQGVGVYLASTLARGFDGRMWAENRAAGGLEVLVELPRAASPVDQGTTETASAARTG